MHLIFFLLVCQALCVFSWRMPTTTLRLLITDKNVQCVGSTWKLQCRGDRLLVYTKLNGGIRCNRYTIINPYDLGGVRVHRRQKYEVFEVNGAHTFYVKEQDSPFTCSCYTFLGPNSKRCTHDGFMFKYNTEQEAQTQMSELTDKGYDAHFCGDNKQIQVMDPLPMTGSLTDVKIVPVIKLDLTMPPSEVPVTDYSCVSTKVMDWKTEYDFSRNIETVPFLGAEIIYPLTYRLSIEEKTQDKQVLLLQKQYRIYSPCQSQNITVDDIYQQNVNYCMRILIDTDQSVREQVSCGVYTGNRMEIAAAPGRLGKNLCDGLKDGTPPYLINT